MDKTKCIYSSVSEHDIDLMLLNLFASDPEFVRFFLKTASVNASKVSVESIELSKTDPRLGESDITVLLKSGRKKIALLIEDKINAVSMPEQPERYIKRGKKAVKNGEYDDFVSFLVCPRKYYENNKEAHKYPHIVFYEDIRDHLSRKTSPLSYTFIQQLDQAIDKAKRPPQSIIDEQANAFFRKYKDYQEANYPSLNLRTKRNSNGYWAQYATRLGNVYLLHKIQDGEVILVFTNASTRMSEVELVAKWLRQHGMSEVRAVIASKAGAIHADVPKLDRTIPFEENDISKINKCFEVIGDLLETANVFALANDLASRQ